MLRLDGVSKKFGDKLAVEGVRFEIKKGEIVGLLGPNGAGKTTIMRMITGFLTASEGDILWNGKMAQPKSVEYRRNIGYLPENNPLYPSMTPLEYLRFVGALKQVADLEKEIGKVVDKCGLTTVAGQRIETLSKGYRQRVGLAATLLGDPPLLVLDEPTSGLDPNQIIEVRDLINKLSKNKSILLSTHILPEAKMICDRVVIINRGRLVLDADVKKVKNLEKKFVELTT